MKLDTRTLRTRKRLLSCAVALSALAFTAGCGGGGNSSALVQPQAATEQPLDAAQTAPVTTDDPDTGLLRPAVASSTRRGIQSIYWLALDGGFASSICNTLKQAPGGVEIEFCPAFDSGKGWGNATTAVSALKGKGLTLTVDFGHGSIAPDKSPSDWGKYFYSFFSANYKSVNFVLETANEDASSDSTWRSNMTKILDGLRTEWIARQPNVAFPTSSLTLRRTVTGTAPLAFHGVSIPVDSEYHFPAGSTSVWNSGASVISNDGEVVYYPGKQPAVNGSALVQVPLSDFTSHYGGRTKILWAPVLHEWHFDKGTYYASSRDAVPDPNEKTKFLALLAQFLKS